MSLRRSFRYPDSDSDDALDEQSQEHLISSLAHRNTLQDQHSISLLLSLPLLSIIAYVPHVFRVGGGTSLPSCLAITSLLITAYLLRKLPPTKTGIALVDSRQSQNGVKGPLERYLPYMNVALALLLVVFGLLRGGFLVLGCLPGGIYAVVIVAKVVMASVDPERDLVALRYRYKGA